MGSILNGPLSSAWALKSLVGLVHVNVYLSCQNGESCAADSSIVNMDTSSAESALLVMRKQ